MKFIERLFKNKSWDKKCEIFIDHFLSEDDELINELKYGKKEDIKQICQFLIEIPIDMFLNHICDYRNYESKDIFQFSNFRDVVLNTPAILEARKEELSFLELGKKLEKSKTNEASIKYGENHAKAAQELLFVDICFGHPSIVKNTNLGDFIVYLDDSSRLELIKRLAIRNKFIYSLVFCAKKGCVNYMDLAMNCLSYSTANRRKSNIKYLVEMILFNSDLLNKIDWSYKK